MARTPGRRGGRAGQLWDRRTGFCASSPAMRRALATTKAKEALTAALRTVLQGRRAFPHDEAMLKGWSLGRQQGATKWTHPIPAWKAALHHCVLLCGERVRV